MAHGNLPEALPRLIGRDDDLGALRVLVETHRLVSIIGAACIGKTVLAQAFAHGQRAAFADGVWLIEFAPVSDATLVVPTVASVLGIQAGHDVQAKALVPKRRACTRLTLEWAPSSWPLSSRRDCPLRMCAWRRSGICRLLPGVSLERLERLLERRLTFLNLRH